MTISEILANVNRELEADKKAFPYYPQQAPSMFLKVQEPINDALQLAMSVTYGHLKDCDITLEDIKPELSSSLYKTIALAIRLLHALNKKS